MIVDIIKSLDNKKYYYSNIRNVDKSRTSNKCIRGAPKSLHFRLDFAVKFVLLTISNIHI